MKVAAEITGVGSRLRRIANNKGAVIAREQERELTWRKRLEKVLQPVAIDQVEGQVNRERQ